MNGINYYVVRYRDDNTLTTRGFASYERGKMMTEVAQCICFNDCTDEEVVEIVLDGRDVYYTGWQPGMVMEFADSETKEIVWSGCFEQWDH